MPTLENLIGKTLDQMTDEELEKVIHDTRKSRDSLYFMEPSVRKERAGQSLEKKLSKKYGSSFATSLINLLDDEEL